MDRDGGRAAPSQGPVTTPGDTTSDDGAPDDGAPGTFTIATTLWRVLRPELRLHRRRLLADLGLAFATALTGALGPYLLYLLLRGVLRNDPVAPWPALVIALFLTLAAFAVLRFAQNDHALRTTESLFLALKQRLVDAVLRKPASFHTAESQAGLTALVARDLDRISTRLRLHAGPMMAAVPLTGAVLAALAVLDWRLGLPAAALSLLHLRLAFAVHRRTAKADHRTRGADSRQQLILTDLLSGAHEIRLFQIQERHRARFVQAAEAVQGRNVAVYGTPAGGYSPRLEFVGSMILIAPVLLGLWLARTPGSGAIPELIPAYLTYASLLLINLRAIETGLRALAVLGNGLAKLDSLLADPPAEVAPIADPGDMPADHTLQLRGVSLRRGARTVLSDLDLTITEGERIAVTGPSGIGKTTLANLILRLEQPDSGQILLGGQPIERFPLPLYLSYFAHVGQSTHLFHASVRDNIGMGWEHVPFDHIVRAARLVRLHEAILQLPAGYDTIIGADRIRLSQGQRQRLALARALIREPAILVLDEFTAALDPATEAAILTDLIDGFPGTTLICLTHSPQVVRRMDRVFRIPDPPPANPPPAHAPSAHAPSAHAPLAHAPLAHAPPRERM